MMQHKVLGRTGLKVPIVGLGTAFLGIPTPNQAAVDSSRRGDVVDLSLGTKTILAGLEAGCTFIDTAPLYGSTLSEQAIGRALRRRPDLAANCTVTTKAGRLREGQDYSYDAVLRHVAASQERLGIERFPIVYIHDQMGVPMERVLRKGGALPALRRLQNEGIIRFLGTAANDPDVNADYIETGEFDAAVVADAWSLLNQHMEKRILPAAERFNVGLVIATPLERGLLATGPVAGTNYLRRNFSRRCLDHVARLQALCSEAGVTLLSVALQWCVRHPLVAMAIPGVRVPQEAVENIEAAQTSIPDELWEELTPLIRHFEAGVDR